MAVRLPTYVGLLYQDLLRIKAGPADPLPPVLPVVLYNGEARWLAPLTLEELIDEVHGGVSQYRPRFRYLLLDEGHYEGRSAPERNLVAALFRLERSRSPEEIRRVVEWLIRWLQPPQQNSLRRVFTVWIHRVLLPPRLPGQTVPEVHTLMEVDAILAERVKQ